jgi:uncharacterized YigZ family protein
MFKTISENITEELVEKKSKFIADVFYVESIRDAEEKIKEIEKKYYDARHHCYAFSIYEEGGVTNRFSDDGEPSGTAGGPMLNIITQKNLSNILVVVTRYFGGILLGTGGLVKAYSGAFQKALEKATIIDKDLGIEATIVVSYSDQDKAKYYLEQNSINIVGTSYEEAVTITVELTKEKYNAIKENIQNLNFKIENIEIIKEKYIKI